MFYDKIQFEADEKVLAQTRRHWFVLFSQFLGLFIAAVFPVVALIIAPYVISPEMMELLDPEKYAIHASYLYAAWLLIIWMGVFNYWTNYYLDLITITNHRVILINQKGFFRRYTGSFRLERLQDMHVEIHGIIPTLLDFGTLHAETAGHGGDNQEFRATNLPNPRRLRSIATKATDDLIKEYRSRPLSSDGV